MKTFEAAANNWQQCVAVVAVSLLPAFAACSGESNQTPQPSQKTAESQETARDTMVAETEAHGSHAHGEGGHGETGEEPHHDKGEGHHHDKQATFGHAAKAAQADRTVEIEAMDIAFKPETVTVEKGETVKFVIKNTGNLEHEFVLGTPEEQKQHAKEMQAMQDEGGMEHHSSANAVSIAPGETKILTWTFTKATPIEYACHVPGHYQADMRGDIKVQ